MSISLDNFAIYQKEFGLKIKLLRESKGLSQLDLASLCNMEKTSISRIENGRTNVTLKTMVFLSKALEINLAEFFNFD